MSGIFKQNITYSLRTLLKNPGFTVTAVLTLALGIGATTAIFSVVYTTLFEPMPYPKPDQLVVLWSKPLGGERDQVSPGDFYEWRKRSQSFQSLEACGLCPGSAVTGGVGRIAGLVAGGSLRSRVWSSNEAGSSRGSR